MSVALHSTRKNWALPSPAGRVDRAPIAPAIFRFVRKALVKSARLFVRASEIFAEARMHKAMIEAELYRSRYTHTSKNDDDLPIVGSAPATQPAPSVSPRVVWRRAAIAVVATAKRVYPVVLTFAIIATIVVATIALRLAIWLPTFRH